ncbi:MAG: hypothetical protein IKP62_07245 [Salinivirgaceae bacterium]|nr:hypothetical protein [Salinivirgaceae bacterium]
MNECMTRDVISMLVEKKGLAISDAMELFYNSQTFEKLSDPKTGLYFQSPVYVFDTLEQEMAKKNE